MLRRKNPQISRLCAFYLLTAIILAFFVFIPQVNAFNALENAVQGLNKAANRGFDGNTNPGVDKGPESVTKSIPEAIGTIIGAGLALIGVVFLVLMIYGGFMWMTARGNEQQVTKAKELILAAIIGLFIVLSAYAITAYVGVTIFN